MQWLDDKLLGMHLTRLGFLDSSLGAELEMDLGVRRSILIYSHAITFCSLPLFVVSFFGLPPSTFTLCSTHAFSILWNTLVSTYCPSFVKLLLLNILKEEKFQLNKIKLETVQHNKNKLIRRKDG